MNLKSELLLPGTYQITVFGGSLLELPLLQS